MDSAVIKSISENKVEFAKLLAYLVEAADSPKARQSLRSLKADVKSGKVFGRASAATNDELFAELPLNASLLITHGYLVSTDAMLQKNTLGSLQKKIGRLLEGDGLNSLESRQKIKDFISVTRSASKKTEFLKRLEGAAAEIKSNSKEFNAIGLELARKLYDSSSGEPAPDGQRKCCSINGESAPCWACGIIIVVIIILILL